MRVIRGIVFDVKQTNNYILRDTFCFCKINKMKWFIDLQQTEVWDREDKTDFFVKEEYDGEEFRDLIQRPHFPVFLKMEAWDTKKQGPRSPIHAYCDFISHGTRLLILLYDCEHVEVYTKGIMDAVLLWMTAKRNRFSSCQFITSTNDTRTKMDVV